MTLSKIGVQTNGAGSCLFPWAAIVCIAISLPLNKTGGMAEQWTETCAVPLDYNAGDVFKTACHGYRQPRRKQ